jgi:hypothetical protein
MTLKITPFCDIAPCSLVLVNRRFRGAYVPLKRRYTIMRLHDGIAQKTAIFILATVRNKCHNIKFFLSEYNIFGDYIVLGILLSLFCTLCVVYFQKVFKQS